MFAADPGEPLQFHFKEMPLTVDKVRGIRAAGLLAALLVCGTAPALAATLRAPLEGGMVAALVDGKQLFLEAPPLRGEGLLRFADRLCGSSKSAARIGAANGGRKRLLVGVRYKVPYALLRPELQLAVVRGLFGRDEVLPDGWRHRVGNGRHGSESLWSVAEWFTGRGDNYRALRAANGMADDQLEPGQSVLIPARLLRPGLRAALPEGSPFHLEYASDEAGDFALYRLKAGEALYSSVVVRFTGQVFAEDVNALAGEIAERSGIGDVTDIPVNYAVKIPLDVLLPEFLPAGDERRREYEAGLAASAQFSNAVTARSLRGITVVLDAGHGGADVGASKGGVWESVYAYDIVLRTRALLLARTAAEVATTTQEGDGYRTLDQDRLPNSRGHRVLTTPGYPIEDSTVGIHLRWYLANSIFRRATSAGGDAASVVFLSIHADSLHPSLRGAMAYVPGARYRSGSYGKTGAVYASRKEYRDGPRVEFSRNQRVRSEGLSRELAQELLHSFRQHDLQIHPDKPVRDKIIRRRRSWVPAVLRYNAIPAQVLLEVCNLANADDRKLLQSRAFRQRVAEAIVAGLESYYGDADGAPASIRVARSAR